MGTWGQVAGGGYGGDENCRPGDTDPRQGLETCGIVELMQSCEILTQVLGDPVWADRVEQLAFNMLPAALDPGQHGTQYVTSPNSV
jgi:Beta-L-arabinofuranosidase, GH127